MMSDTLGQRDSAVFQTIVPQLEADGFEVFLHPSREMLPEFLAGHRPDAIAFKRDRKIAIGIASSGGQSKHRLTLLREYFVGHPDWEFRVVYAPPRAPSDIIPTHSKKLIEEHLDRALAAFDALGPSASLLAAWSALEAAARSAVPEAVGTPQTSLSLIEALASHGHVTPDEADRLRTFARLRNQAAHGRLDLELTKHELAEFVRLARVVLGSPDDSVSDQNGLIMK